MEIILIMIVLSWLFSKKEAAKDKYDDPHKYDVLMGGDPGVE